MYRHFSRSSLEHAPTTERNPCALQGALRTPSARSPLIGAKLAAPSRKKAESASGARQSCAEAAERLAREAGRLLRWPSVANAPPNSLFSVRKVRICASASGKDATRPTSTEGRQRPFLHAQSRHFVARVNAHTLIHCHKRVANNKQRGGRQEMDAIGRAGNSSTERSAKGTGLKSTPHRTLHQHQKRSYPIFTIVLRTRWPLQPPLRCRRPQNDALTPNCPPRVSFPSIRRRASIKSRLFSASVDLSPPLLRHSVE